MYKKLITTLIAGTAILLTVSATAVEAASAAAAVTATSSTAAGMYLNIGNNKGLAEVTLSTPPVIYTADGTITDEYGTAETVPANYGGTVNGKPIPYPGWSEEISPETHLELHWAVLTSDGVEYTIENVLGSVWEKSSSGDYRPTCLSFVPNPNVPKSNWLQLVNGKWIVAQTAGC